MYRVIGEVSDTVGATLGSTLANCLISGRKPRGPSHRTLPQTGKSNLQDAQEHMIMKYGHPKAVAMVGTRGARAQVLDVVWD